MSEDFNFFNAGADATLADAPEIGTLEGDQEVELVIKDLEERSGTKSDEKQRNLHVTLDLSSDDPRVVDDIHVYLNYGINGQDEKVKAKRAKRIKLFRQCFGIEDGMSRDECIGLRGVCKVSEEPAQAGFDKRNGVREFVVSQA